MIPAHEALARLKEGNQRYITEGPGRILSGGAERRGELLEGQTPSAIVPAPRVRPGDDPENPG
jgi:hypothetical protein